VKWFAIQSALALVEAAEEVLGHEEWHQPNWFQESAGFLEPLSEHWKLLKAQWDTRKAVRTLGSGGSTRR